MISNIEPLPFSYVIVKMQNVVCSVPANCSIQSPRFHCQLDHLVSLLLPMIHRATQKETATVWCSDIWTGSERAGIPLQRSATYLKSAKCKCPDALWVSVGETGWTFVAQV